DLTRARHAVQLPDELGTLREPGRAGGVAAGEDAAGWVDDPWAAIGHRALVNQTGASAFLAQTERLVGNEFVRAEAVVQFDDVHVFRTDSRLLVDGLRGAPRHPNARQAEWPRGEILGRVRRHRLRRNLHRTRKPPPGGELRGA